MIFEKVKEVIIDQLGIDGEEVKLESSFKEDLDVDSLDLFEIVSELEDEFEIEFDSEDLGSIKTVNDAVKYIEKTK